MIEDESGGRPIPWSSRLDVVRGGLGQRLESAGLKATSRRAEDEVKAGALLVLCAWSFLFVGGCLFTSYALDVPEPSHSAMVASHVVWEAGALGVSAITSAGLLAIPAMHRSRSRAYRRPILKRAGSTLALTVATVSSAIGWLWFARNLDLAQSREWAWAIATLAWLVQALFAATVISWARTILEAVRGVKLSRRVAYAEAGTAVVVAGVIGVVTTGTVIWWIDLANDRSFMSPHALYGYLGVPEAIMLTALLVAGVGVVRVVRASVRLAFERQDAGIAS